MKEFTELRAFGEKEKHKTVIKKKLILENVYHNLLIEHNETTPWRLPDFKTVCSLPSVIFAATMHVNNSMPSLELHNKLMAENSVLEICT